MLLPGRRLLFLFSVVLLFVRGDDLTQHSPFLQERSAGSQTLPVNSSSRRLFDFWARLMSLFGGSKNNAVTAIVGADDNTFTPIRINCGGGAIQAEGKQWKADQYFNNGMQGYNWLAVWFQGAASPDLFQRYRYDLGLFGDPLEYKIPVSKGNYDVYLYFPNKFNLFGSITHFDVSIEGVNRYNSRDISSGPDAAAGTKVKTTLSVSVTDGELNIVLDAVSSMAYIGAIEIIAAAPLQEPLVTPLPTRSPTPAPTRGPTKAPVAVPTASPIAAPVHAPTRTPTGTTTRAPTKVTKPTPAPITPVTSRPTRAPTKVTKAPVTPVASPPTQAPVTTKPTASPVTKAPVAIPTGEFKNIYINAGGGNFDDLMGHRWEDDTPYVSGGTIYGDFSSGIADTQDDPLYQTERFGTFSYNIPIQVGNYEIILHFAELYFKDPYHRVFNVKVEGEPFLKDVDIVQLAGSNRKAITMEGVKVVSDGFLNIAFDDAIPKRNQAKLSAIEVKLVAPHLAHAVTNGPYTVVDTKGVGSATVYVDGRESHTHAPGITLNQWIWRTGSTIIGTGEQISFSLEVGIHTITLTVIDPDGNENTESTTVTVHSSDFPNISGISPDTGSISGGLQVTITGTAFNHPATNILVKFGLHKLTGASIELISSTTIRVKTPAVGLGLPTPVSVVTPVGESNHIMFTYVSGMPIAFTSGKIERIQAPTAAAWGPDRRLYVGTNNGIIVRVSFVDGGFKVDGWVNAEVAKFRSILGIAFDPLDTSPNPNVYFSHSFFFHEDSTSSSRQAINGKVSVAKGANLDIIEDVVTGLPVSDHDHGLMGIEFGDNGELYICVGGNTNAGVPGQLSGSGIQKENVLSAAVLVAHLSRPTFDGNIKYDASDDGNQNGGFDVEVFASGTRNPYGITQHSNGYLYSTDNGANLGYGDISTSCTTQRAEQIDDDKLNLIEAGKYYGHANRKRGETDERQCIWHSGYDAAKNGYTPPLLVMPSSSDGITEWRSNHFGGQLRHNLIISQFQGPLYRVILSPDGRSVIPESNPPLPLVGEDGLSVVQAPSGELIEIRFQSNQIWYHRPVEPETTAVVVKSVFPFRGSEAGGSTLHVFGKNLDKNGPYPTVTVGGRNCPVTQVKAFRVACTLPGGSGTVDVVLSSGSETSVFGGGYRYIQGRE